MKHFLRLELELADGSIENIIFGDTMQIKDVFEILKEEDSVKVLSIGAFNIVNYSGELNLKNIPEFENQYKNVYYLEKPERPKGKGLMAFFE